MSQFNVDNGSGSGGGATTFVTDSGVAVEVGGIINIVTPGGGTQGIATSGAGSTVTITSSVNNITVTTYTSGSGNWSPLSTTRYVKAILYGGGGGGGSGRKGTSAASGGGGGGGGGQIVISEGVVAAFPGPIAYSVGAAAAGGISQTTDATDGTAGTNGNNTTFGTLIAAGGLGGGAGVNGNSASLTGRTTISNYFFIAGSTLPRGANGIGTIAANIQTAIAGPGGGGSGGDNATARQAGSGPAFLDPSGTVTLIAAASGGIASGTIDGANAGAAITTGPWFSAGMGGGGGGGVNGGTVAGNGGAGAAPGGGGGGGGGGISTQANSGSGGTGAAGQITIIEFS